MSKTGRNHTGNGKSFKVLKQDKKCDLQKVFCQCLTEKKSTKGKLEVSQMDSFPFVLCSITDKLGQIIYFKSYRLFPSP